MTMTRITPNREEATRPPTAQQWRFAQLIVAQCMTVTDCYRAVYPARRGTRSAQTEWAEAARLRRHPSVIWAIERITAGDQLPVKVQRIQRKMQARLARRAVDQILRERGRRADTILAGRELHGPHPEELPRKQAWGVFLRACQAIQTAKGGNVWFLPPEERTRLVFEHFAPIVPPEPFGERPLPPGESDAHTAEIGALIRTQQLAHIRRAFVPDTGTQPGCSPQEPAVADDTSSIAAPRSAAGAPVSGEWRLLPVAGSFPPRRRRVWIPATGDLTGDSQ
jgi:hypothetical protein